MRNRARAFICLVIASFIGTSPGYSGSSSSGGWDYDDYDWSSSGSGSSSGGHSSSSSSSGGSSSGSSSSSSGSRDYDDHYWSSSSSGSSSGGHSSSSSSSGVSSSRSGSSSSGGSSSGGHWSEVDDDSRSRSSFYHSVKNPTPIQNSAWTWSQLAWTAVPVVMSLSAAVYYKRTASSLQEGLSSAQDLNHQLREQIFRIQDLGRVVVENLPNCPKIPMECPICMVSMVNIALTCGHLLCADCEKKLPAKTCHICRAPYSAANVLKIFFGGAGG